MTALRAKLGNRGKFGAAVGAHRGQVRTALLAVLRPSAIFVRALRTPHENSLGAVGSTRLRSVAARTIGSKALCRLLELPRGEVQPRTAMRHSLQVRFKGY